MSADLPLHIKYRPTQFSEVIGQQAIIKSLRKVLKDARPHAFLFYGPSGCGKTTLARILAAEVGCDPTGVVEIDAATNAGVDAMRAIASSARYRSLGGSESKMLIVDECHALSKAAWQSLLLSIEQPPEHLYWSFCTTEYEKVPTTIRTRCHCYQVRAVPLGELSDHLAGIADMEAMKGADDSILQLCAKEAHGSVRQALVNLSATRGCRNRQEAYALLANVVEEGDVVKLARMLCDGTLEWSKALAQINALKDESAESIRLIILNYTSKVLLDTRDPKKAQRLLAVLDQFSTPFYQSEGMAPVLLALGRLLWG